MKVFDGWEGLAKKLEGLGLTDGPVLVLVCEECPIFGQFHDHIDNIVFDDGVPQLDDVRVVDRWVQIDLSLQKQQLVLAYIPADVYLNENGFTTLTA